MKNYFCTVLIICLTTLAAQAQTANQILVGSYLKFSSVQNFSGKVHIDFNLPSINIDKMDGKVYYKAPKKFRVKMTGIAFLPKQDPFYAVRLLSDTTKYVSVINGDETYGGAKCKIITVIPHNDPELVMAKLWIDTKDLVVMQSEMTTKSNGSGKAAYTYGNQKGKALPDHILYTIDMATFKMPKMVAVDINSKKKKNELKADKGTGTIAFYFSEYVVNKGVDDKVFVVEKQ
jgi:outer membrane lipoprotein-sorting protein